MLVIILFGTMTIDELLKSGKSRDCEGCDASLLNALYACSDKDIQTALLGIPGLATKFTEAVNAIKAAISRGNKKDRPVIAAFVTRIYDQLQDTQRQRLEEQSGTEKSVVMQFMHYIIPEIEKWKE